MQNIMTQEMEAKLILVGDSNVGKTSIINRFVNDEFKESIIPTLSSNYSMKVIKVDSITVRLQIWDTAGDEKYRSIVPMFYRGSQAAFIVYAIDDSKSFENVKIYVESLQSVLAPENLALFLVANKIDKADSRKISSEEGEKCAQQIKATFLEVSALSGQGITEIFNLAAAQIAEKQDKQIQQKVDMPNNAEPNNCNC
ncbi:small GTP-binding protein [Histomonas meleagridis]|uniref:small GTP-binding protein n=1 Tax=Histomonas meleagridis TaxID=135588 RepID=UPI0035593B39|nr:small GTP-binding protein [Histomonas meleagridis]KAH0799449.1 small GTP-binding protein [Histomonas meleagridis]